MTAPTRLKPDARAQQIVETALHLSGQGNYGAVQRKEVADHLSLTPPAITYHFATMGALRTAVMRAAISRGNLGVLAQGLLLEDADAKKAPLALRRRALEFATLKVLKEG